MEKQVKKPINYKKWAFIFIILHLAVGLISSYLVVDFARGNGDTEPFVRNLKIVSIIHNLSLLLGCLSIVKSILYKEKRNYLFYISIIAYPIFIADMVIVLLRSGG